MRRKETCHSKWKCYGLVPMELMELRAALLVPETSEVNSRAIPYTVTVYDCVRVRKHCVLWSAVFPISPNERHGTRGHT